jgi:hypothetical protein
LIVVAYKVEAPIFTNEAETLQLCPKARRSDWWYQTGIANLLS